MAFSTWSVPLLVALTLFVAHPLRAENYGINTGINNSSSYSNLSINNGIGAGNGNQFGSINSGYYGVNSYSNPANQGIGRVVGASNSINSGAAYGISTNSINSAYAVSNGARSNQGVNAYTSGYSYSLNNQANTTQGIGSSVGVSGGAFGSYPGQTLLYGGSSSYGSGGAQSVIGLGRGGVGSTITSYTGVGVTNSTNTATTGIGRGGVEAPLGYSGAIPGTGVYGYGSGANFSASALTAPMRITR